MAIDENKLHEFLGKAVGDLGAAMSAVLMTIGDELGYYKALAKEALSPAEQMRLDSLRPARAKTVDDLKQERRGRSASDECRV